MMAEVVVVVVTPSSSCFAIVMTSLKRSCQFFPGRGTSRHFLRRIGGGGTAGTAGSSARREAPAAAPAYLRGGKSRFTLGRSLF